MLVADRDPLEKRHRYSQLMTCVDDFLGGIHQVAMYELGRKLGAQQGIAPCWRQLVDAVSNRAVQQRPHPGNHDLLELTVIDVHQPGADLLGRS